MFASLTSGILACELSLMSRRTVSIRMAEEGSGTDLGRLLNGRVQLKIGHVVSRLPSARPPPPGVLPHSETVARLPPSPHPGRSNFLGRPAAFRGQTDSRIDWGSGLMAACAGQASALLPGGSVCGRGEATPSDACLMPVPATASGLTGVSC